LVGSQGGLASTTASVAVSMTASGFASGWTTSVVGLGGAEEPTEAADFFCDGFLWALQDLNL